MEYIIGLIVILVLLLLVGVSWDAIIAGIFLLLCALLASMLLMFAVCLIRLVFMKKYEADFLRVDKSPKGKMKVAYYKYEDKEYSCLFPAEPFFKDKFYPVTRKHRIWLGKRGKTVFDSYAVVTCVVGFVFSLALVLSMIYIVLFY